MWLLMMEIGGGLYVLCGITLYVRAICLTEGMPGADGVEFVKNFVLSLLAWPIIFNDLWHAGER